VGARAFHSKRAPYLQGDKDRPRFFRKCPSSSHFEKVDDIEVVVAHYTTLMLPTTRTDKILDRTNSSNALGGQ
jgi:hypothetical protein